MTKYRRLRIHLEYCSTKCLKAQGGLFTHASWLRLHVTQYQRSQWKWKVKVQGQTIFSRFFFFLFWGRGANSSEENKNKTLTFILLISLIVKTRSVPVQNITAITDGNISGKTWRNMSPVFCHEAITYFIPYLMSNISFPLLYTNILFFPFISFF